MRFNIVSVFLSIFIFVSSVFANPEIKNEIELIDNLLYSENISSKKDGLERVIKMGESGSLYAQKALALYYSSGNKPNYKEAAYWQEKAVEMNNDMLSASFILDYWRQGLIDDFDEKKIFKWHKYFVDKHNIDKYAYFVGQGYFYGKIVEKNYSLALVYLEKSLNYGDFYTPRLLAEIYRYGLGVNKDLNKAKEYYNKSIEFQDLWGVHNLAVMFLDENKNKGALFPASELFETDLNLDDKQLKRKFTFNLGLSYLYGWGVEQDLDKAKLYLKMSIKEGSEEAKNLLHQIEK
ncbi:TPA: tetratricopeptide repeat protein [Mannheimia haemolytica]